MFKTSTARLLVVTLAVTMGFVAFLSANHSWGNYHWARKSNPFTLTVVDSVTSSWDAYLGEADTDWSFSFLLDLTKVEGALTSFERRRCRPVSGRIRACNYSYGNNGWLGLAQIWVSGSHIVQGAVKVNDTYFNTATYNKPAWRRLVMCQEVGHTLGLDHQDEDFYNGNLGTCMDYTDDPDGTLKGQLSNEHPNQHDYDQLATMYGHADTGTTLSNPKASGQLPPAMRDIDFEGPGQWGRLVATTRNGKTAIYELDFGGGNKVFTFVIWA